MVDLMSNRAHKATLAADQRIESMITAKKINVWKARIYQRINPVFDGSINVNILPVSTDHEIEIIADICRQASGVATGLYLEDLIPICNHRFIRSPNGSGHDIHIPGLLAVDVKMSTETVKKGDKKKVSKSLRVSSRGFRECFWVEFFGEARSEEIDSVMWYSGSDAHVRLGLDSEDIEWIARTVYAFRQRTYREIAKALDD